MSVITLILASLVVLEHFFIMYLETFATQSDQTVKTFQMTKEQLAQPAVSVLFKNLGIYNGLVGAGVAYGLMTGNKEIVGLFVVFVLLVAVYGAITSSPKILLKQGGPAILTLLSLLVLG